MAKDSFSDSLVVCDNKKVSEIGEKLKRPRDKDIVATKPSKITEKNQELWRL